MATTIDLVINDGQRGVSNWDREFYPLTIGRAKLLPPEVLHPNDSCGGFVLHQHIHIDAVAARAHPRQIHEALMVHAETGFTRNCSHTHDCCGCLFVGWVDVRKVGRRDFFLTVNVNRNI